MRPSRTKNLPFFSSQGWNLCFKGLKSEIIYKSTSWRFRSPRNLVPGAQSIPVDRGSRLPKIQFQILFVIPDSIPSDPNLIFPVKKSQISVQFYPFRTKSDDRDLRQFRVWVNQICACFRSALRFVCGIFVFAVTWILLGRSSESNISSTTWKQFMVSFGHVTQHTHFPK